MLHHKPAFAAALRPPAALHPLVWQGAALALGVLGGGARMLGGTAPLGLALVMGCSRGYILSCGAGAVLGGLLFLEPVKAFCLAGAAAAAMIIRLACPDRFWPGAAAGVGTTLLVPLLLALQHSLQPAEACWAAATAGMAAAVGYGLFRCPAAKNRNSLLWLGLLFCGAQSLAWPPFQPGLTLLAAYSLGLAQRGNEERTALSALVLAGWVSAAGPDYAFGAMALAVGAVLAAWFLPGDRLGGAAIALGSCALGAALAPDLQAVAGLGVSAALGIGAFLWLPARCWEAILPEEAAVVQPGLKGAASRLEQVADTLADIADTVNQVYRRLPVGGESFDKVVDHACGEVCAGCRSREDCWVARYNESMEGINALRPILEEEGRLALESLPRQFCGCIHPVDFCAALTRGQALRLARREERVRCVTLRSALTEQYGALAQALAVMARQLQKATAADPHKAQRLARLFSGLGLEPLEAAVEQENDGRLRARVTVARTSFGQEELAELAQEVGRLCRRNMALPLVENHGGSTTLAFAEKPIFLPVFGLAGRAAGEVSGDVAEQFCDAHDQARMLLCDGMGTGKPAAVDGALAARLTGQLLRAGFDSQAAARLVNVTLSLKSQADSSATLDLISTDLFTGRAELFKAGAAASYLVQQGQVRRVEGPGLPMGVVDTVMGKTARVQLREGDMAVLVSDGALADGAEWLEQQLELCAKVGNTPQEVADILADGAKRRGSPTHPDDITVAVMRLDRAI